MGCQGISGARGPRCIDPSTIPALPKRGLLLNVRSGPAFLSTDKGSFEVVAENGKVKDALAALPAGASLVIFQGKLENGQVKMTDLKADPVQLQSFKGELAKGGRSDPLKLKTSSGIYPLKPMTKDAAEALSAFAASGTWSARDGVINGVLRTAEGGKKVLEVWGAVMPMHTRPM